VSLKVLNAKITVFCDETAHGLTISVTEQLILNPTHWVLMMYMLKITKDNLMGWRISSKDLTWH